MTTKKQEYFSDEENFNIALDGYRQMTIKDIKIELKQSSAMHYWAVNALRQALVEKQLRMGIK
jgi:hypothetical protein